MDLLRLISAASRLSSLQRFSMERMTKDESVLEHMGFVALVSLVIATEINGSSPGLLNIGTVMSKAILHDMEEIITGDIPRVTKRSSIAATALFDDLSVRSIERVADIMSSAPSFCSYLRNHHACAKDGAEGLVVAIADMLAVVFKIWQEVIIRNNLSMTRQAFTVRAQMIKIEARVRSDMEGEERDFLLSILSQGSVIADEAAGRDLPIHASIRED